MFLKMSPLSLLVDTPTYWSKLPELKHVEPPIPHGWQYLHPGSTCWLGVNGCSNYGWNSCVDPTTSTSWLGMSFESACSVVFRRHLAGPGEIFFSAPSNNAATTELQAIITMSREVFSGTWESKSAHPKDKPGDLSLGKTGMKNEDRSGKKQFKSRKVLNNDEVSIFSLVFLEWCMSFHFCPHAALNMSAFQALQQKLYVQAPEDCLGWRKKPGIPNQTTNNSMASTITSYIHAQKKDVWLWEYRFLAYLYLENL